MPRFRTDNTDGYDERELAELNAAWQKITSHGAPDERDDDPDIQSMFEHWQAELLASYDAGKRGEALVAWFYA
jgi:hypothetical protein